MKLRNCGARALVANALWAASNLPAWRAFKRALHQPEAAQQRVLDEIISRTTRTAFGRQHDFQRINSYADFAANVPLRDYGEMEPWIDRIRAGEADVLTSEPVTRLATTGGTSGARKLIPYTAGLQAELNRAIGPWIVDLFHQQPSRMAGCAYWSMSPVATADAEPSAVPIGFEEDAQYLGGVRRHLVDAVMAVPASVRHAPTMEDWRRQTIEHLSRRKDLRIISVWHPSFLSLLLDHLSTSAASAWPQLKLVSCWGDGHAALAMNELQGRLPGVAFQPKGLIATEGIISIPFAGCWPLAIRSHFFEFVRSDGAVSRAHELVEEEVYEVVLTTSGGLYRYRLNDRVQVNGLIGKTPSIRFVGKSQHISDRFGEKLSEAFVGGILRGLMNEAGASWRFAMLAPDGARYTLYLEGEASVGLATRLDLALFANPHYAYCRRLGQLAEVSVYPIQRDAWSSYTSRLIAEGQRLGEIKPVALSALDDWSRRFQCDSIKHMQS